MDKYIGKKLDGRYEITELIGVGGMAEVYKGVDVIDNKPVAIKILKKEYAENEEFLRRFRNESKAIAVLSHPNIVKIYDVGFSEKLDIDAALLGCKLDKVVVIVVDIQLLRQQLTDSSSAASKASGDSDNAVCHDALLIII